MTTFELLSAPTPPGPVPPPVCQCPGKGPWDVLMAVNIVPDIGESVALTHVDCGLLMELPEWIEAYGDDVPMRLTLMHARTGDPQDEAWFELAPRALDVRVIQPSDMERTG